MGFGFYDPSLLYLSTSTPLPDAFSPLPLSLFVALYLRGVHATVPVVYSKDTQLLLRRPNVLWRGAGDGKVMKKAKARGLGAVAV